MAKEVGGGAAARSDLRFSTGMQSLEDRSGFSFAFSYPSLPLGSGQRIFRERTGKKGKVGSGAASNPSFRKIKTNPENPSFSLRFVF